MPASHTIAEGGGCATEYSGTSQQSSEMQKTSIINTILGPTGVTNIFLTSERGKPLYCSKNAQNIWFQSVRYREVSLYLHQDQVIIVHGH